MKRSLYTGCHKIDTFKIVSRIGFNKTAARYAAIKNKEKLLERLNRPILDIRGSSRKIQKKPISERSSEKRSKSGNLCQRTHSMGKQITFNRAHIKMVNESVAMAEELVSEFFKMSTTEWLRPKYDVKTAADLSKDEIVDGPFAQIIRYEGKLKDASLGSASYDFYKICLQDHAILSTTQNNPHLELFSFVLYIITHELIHIIRFSKFLQNFDASPNERMLEETRVHELTHQILSPVRVGGLSSVFQFYKEWRTPIDGMYNT